MTTCRHHEVQLGQILDLPECTAYGHPYSVDRTNKNVSGEAGGTRPRDLPAGQYRVLTTTCPMMQNMLWVRLDVEHSDMTWVRLCSPQP